MAEQLALDSAPTVDMPDRRRTPTEKWEQFLQGHPWALAEIARTTEELTAQGVRATIAVVWEELRARHRTDGDPYRWDNSLRAPAAAMMRRLYPDLAVHMRTRRDRRG